MKNFIKVFSVILILFTSCGPNDDEVIIKKSDYIELIGDRTNIPEYPKPVMVPPTNGSTVGAHKIKWLDLVVIDSCEYFIGYSVYYDGGPVMTHKGNCKFCIERELRMHRIAYNLNWNNSLLDSQFSYKKH